MAVLAVEQTRVAERLARLRAAHSLTQEAAASRAGVTLRQWQRWESGESEPYARNIAKISDEFSIPLAELVGAEDALEPSQLDRIEAKLDAVHALLNDREKTENQRIADIITTVLARAQQPPPSEAESQAS